MLKIFRQLGWFVAVGTAAAAIHWLVAVLIVRSWGLQPLTANIFGWLTAFGASFIGHYNYTFKQSDRRWTQSAWRFFRVSLGGFAANELLYYWLLQTTAIPYDILLALILLIVAFGTFILSRFWAFK